MKNVSKLTNGKRSVIIAKNGLFYDVINQGNVITTEDSYNDALHFALGYLQIIENF